MLINDLFLLLFRPMVFEFAGDRGVNLGSQWRQFMFGDSILVAPVLEADALTLDLYFPRHSYRD